VGKAEEKRLLGRHGHRFEDSIKQTSRSRMRGCGLDSSVSGQGLEASSCDYSNAPLGSHNSLGIMYNMLAFIKMLIYV
jgi:hypothetical protein